MEDDKYVICQICGVQCKTRLSSHLKQAHNMTTKEYKQIYPGYPVISDKEYQRMVAHNQSSKMRQLIAERNKDPEFIKKCQAGYTEERRQAQAELMREISKRCWEDPVYRENHRQMARETQARENKKPEVIERKSKMFQELWKDSVYAEKALTAPKNHPYGRQCRHYSDKFECEYYCRSQGEYEFVKLCEDLDYVTELEAGYGYSIVYDQGVYIPDYLVNHKYLIEVKYEDDPIEDHKNKVNAAIDYCKSNGYIFCYVNRFSGINKIKESGFDSVSVTQRI